MASYFKFLSRTFFTLMLFLSLFTPAFGQFAQPDTKTTTTTTGPGTTTIWVTGTPNGATTTFLSPYTQTFYSMYASFYTPSAGSVGLGSISGTVGTIRVYSSTTVNATPSLRNSNILQILMSLTPIMHSHFFVGSIFASMTLLFIFL